MLHLFHDMVNITKCLRLTVLGLKNKKLGKPFCYFIISSILVKLTASRQWRPKGNSSRGGTKKKTNHAKPITKSLKHALI